MKTALVLSGGGGRGAYQIGVIKALKDLNIKCDIVTGSSIGSVNAAVYTEDRIDLAEDLWKEINFKSVFDIDIEYKTKKELAKKYLKYAKKGGLEPSNLKKTLIKYIDIDKIYNSKIDYGITTVRYPKFKLLNLTKDDIPKDKLIDYIIASCTVYPFFKLKEIENNKYVDGGFRSPIPYRLAKKMGANNFIIVNISMVGNFYKPPKGNNITYIKSKNYIGNPLIFDSNISKNNLKYGYNDTMKAYKKCEGYKYTFKNNYYKKNKIISSKKIYFNILDNLGRIFNIDDTKIYDIDTFNSLLALEIEKTNYGNNIPLNNIHDSKEKIVYLFNKLKDNNKKYKSLSKEYKCAYYLYKYI